MAEVPSQERTRAVGRMFGRIARRYDLGNRVLSIGRDQAWRRRAAVLLDPSAGDVVLDIGAGTADLAIETAPRARSVVAIDLSAEMARRGLAKARSALPQPNIDFGLGDALRLPFASETFNGATAAFTVRNLVDSSQAFREFYRILKPGGRFVCLEFTPPPSGVLGALYRPYLSYVLPAVGGVVAGNRGAYRYLADTISAFPGPDALAQRIREAGFPHVDYHLLNRGTVAIHVGSKGKPTEEP